MPKYLLILLEIILAIFALSLNLKIGDTVKVNVTAKDYDGNNIPLKWSSKDEKVATAKDGVITAVREGQTNIVVNANGKTIEIDVIVTKQDTQKPTTLEDQPSDTTKPNEDLSHTTKPSEDSNETTSSPNKSAVETQPNPSQSAPSTTNTNTTDSKPKTSDDSDIVLYASIASLAFVSAAILILNKKKKALK